MTSCTSGRLCILDNKFVATGGQISTGKKSCTVNCESDVHYVGMICTKILASNLAAKSTLEKGAKYPLSKLSSS